MDLCRPKRGHNLLQAHCWEDNSIQCWFSASSVNYLPLKLISKWSQVVNYFICLVICILTKRNVFIGGENLSIILCNCFFKIYLFIYFWLCCVFVSVRELSLVAASGGHSSSRCAGLSLSWPLLLWSTSSRRAGSVIVAHGPSCSAACGILPDQGSNPCPLH